MKAVRILWIVLTNLTVICLLAGCGGKPEADAEVTHDSHVEGGAEETIVHLDQHKVFHAGIRIDTVRRKSLPIPLSLTGRVTFNERTRAHITARLSGRIDTVRAYVNDHVKSGEHLLSLYSQEYQAMQFEFLQAVKRLDRSLEKGGADETAKSIYESARRKLSVVGTNDEDIQRLERTRSPETHLIIRAPFAGTILGSQVRIGSFVETGDDLFDIADLSTLWVLADMYEKDLPLVREGMPAAVVVSAYPDKFTGRISTVYSVVDEKTRTVKIRLDVKNQDGRLKPAMFCNVDVQTALGTETIKIPDSAVLGETEHHFVFIALDDTTFQKREILTGVETREFAEVLDGLLEGEKIVVKGGFFLKSELAKETFGEEH